MFKAQRKETTWNDFDIYLAVEYLGSNPLTVMADEKICVNATYFKNCATKCEEIWNPLDEYKIYVEEAQKRGLSCGIQTN